MSFDTYKRTDREEDQTACRVGPPFARVRAISLDDWALQNFSEAVQPTDVTFQGDTPDAWICLHGELFSRLGYWRLVLWTRTRVSSQKLESFITRLHLNNDLGCRKPSDPFLAIEADCPSWNIIAPPSKVYMISSAERHGCGLLGHHPAYRARRCSSWCDAGVHHLMSHYHRPSCLDSDEQPRHGRR